MVLKSSSTSTDSSSSTAKNWEENFQQAAFINISSIAHKRVQDKRKRKGLGDTKPREKNVYGQLLVYGSSAFVTKTLAAPLERTRILMQTLYMQNLKANERPEPTFLRIS
jgi:hypothetical protein